MQKIQVINCEGKPITIDVPENVDVDRFLSIHVKKGNNDWTGYIKLEHGNWYYEVDAKTKIKYECARFMNAIINADKGALRELSPVLEDFYESVDSNGISRVLRMLIFLRSILTVDKNGNSTTEDIDKEIAQVKNECDLLDQIVNEVEKATCVVNINDDDKWQVALSLLLIKAVAYSQCKFAGPVFWEPFSAGAARNELESDLPPNYEKKDNLLNSISYLIRYQSEPGQYVRHTGSGEHREIKIDDQNFLFSDKVELSCRGNYPNNSQKFSQLQYALMIMALVEDVRNTRLEKLPEEITNTLPNIVNIVNSGVENHKEFEINAKEICENLKENLFKTSEVRKFKKTWGYSGANSMGRHFKNENEKKLEDFKVFIENNLNSEPNKLLDWTVNFNDICKITFDAHHQEKQDKLEEKQDKLEPYKLEAVYIRKVMEKTDNDEKISEFKKYFTAKLIDIPSCFSYGESSYAVRISLKDHIIAQYMLPFYSISDESDVEEKIGENSGELLNYIFQKL